MHRGRPAPGDHQWPALCPGRTAQALRAPGEPISVAEIHAYCVVLESQGKRIELAYANVDAGPRTAGQGKSPAGSPPRRDRQTRRSRRQVVHRSRREAVRRRPGQIVEVSHGRYHRTHRHAAARCPTPLGQGDPRRRQTQGPPRRAAEGRQPGGNAPGPQGAGHGRADRRSLCRVSRRAAVAAGPVGGAGPESRPAASREALPRPPDGADGLPRRRARRGLRVAGRDADGRRVATAHEPRRAAVGRSALGGRGDDRDALPLAAVRRGVRRRQRRVSRPRRNPAACPTGPATARSWRSTAPCRRARTGGSSAWSTRSSNKRFAWGPATSTSNRSRIPAPSASASTARSARWRRRPGAVRAHRFPLQDPGQDGHRRKARPPGRRNCAAVGREARRSPRQHGPHRLRREDGHANPRQGGDPHRADRPGLRPAAIGQPGRVDPHAARADAGDRAHRQRQEHDALCLPQSAQRAGHEHLHRRRPGRIQVQGDEPGPGQGPSGIDVRLGPPGLSAAGPRRDHGRQGPRPGDGPDLPSGG